MTNIRQSALRLASVRSNGIAQGGVSLVELMVALVLGLFLIFGAVTIYSKSRTTYRTTEAVARLQETARYAFDTIEPDVRMASYWGLASRADYIVNGTVPGDDRPAELDDAAGEIDDCGDNFGINLQEYLAGVNGADAAGTWPLDCAPFRNEWREDTDVLVVRRGGETQPVTLDPGRLYLQTSRIQGAIFIAPTGCPGNDPKNPACIPADYSPPASETRTLEATVYYISNESTARDDVPSLRRKRLVNGSMMDEEVVSGVEDLQVQFGVDTNGDTNADTYVDPETDPALYGGAIVSATIWLRVRGEDPEIGFTDDRAYTAGDSATTPGGNFRRFLISKTIQLRNTRS
jgi:type IV pilus assembly protein PilW